MAATYTGISGDQWQRPGRRSDGSVFTAESLGRYHLHDVVHHLHDIGHDPRSMTVAAYSGSAAAYAAGTAAMPDSVRRLLDRFAATLGAGPGCWRSAAVRAVTRWRSRRAGLQVRRTDVTPGFVELLVSQGHPADLLDPLTDDLLDPADPRLYDGVWANACLLHVARPDLPVVLSRLAEATRAGGLFQLSLKEGDGARWSTHGHVDGPRYFTFWREEPLRAALDAAGWSVLDPRARSEGQRGEPWLEVLAERRA